MISPETLRRYPHFAGLKDDCLKTLASISDEVSFAKGETLFEESGDIKASGHIYDKGERAPYLMLLASGNVDIINTFGSGKEVTVGSLVAGDLMAISALIPPYHLTATGIARSDGAYLRFNAERLRSLCDEVPELGHRLMLAVANAAMIRLSATRIQLAAMS